MEDALCINGNAHEEVGKGNAKKNGGNAVGKKVDGIPYAAPERAGYLVTELIGDGAEDEHEEQKQERHIEGREHDGVGLGKGRKGDTACRNEPHLVAIPEGACGIVHDAALAFVFGGKGKQASDAKVKAVKNKVECPEQTPENEPYGFQHGYTPSGPLRAYLISRKMSRIPRTAYTAIKPIREIRMLSAGTGDTASEVRMRL